MKNNLLTNGARAFLLIIIAAFSFSYAVAQEDKMMKKDDDKMMAQDDKMMMEKMKLPVVAIIKADWCGICRKLEPTMTELMSAYGEKLNFVVLDVTDEKTTAQAAATAKKYGLESFFAANKGKTSTVAVFNAKHKQLYKTNANYDRKAYTKAFDKALGKSMKG